MSDLARTLAEHGAASFPVVQPSTLRTENNADRIVDAISEGTPMRQVCREIGAHWTSVYDWMDEDSAFALRIAHARRVGADAIAQRARLTLRGKKADEGGESTGDTLRDKAIAEFDLKLLAKWQPKEYGDKLDLTTAGNAIQPSVVVFEAVFPAREGDGE